MKRFLIAVGLLFGLMLQASAEWVPIQFTRNTGGLNDGEDSTAIQDNEAADMQNFVLTTGGAVTKRQGISRINASAISTTAVFTGLHFYKQADGDRFLLATVSDGSTDRIYKMDYSGGTGGPDGTWDNISGSLSLGFGTDDQADFANAEDELVIEDGVTTTAPYKWTGTGNAVALGGSPVNASMVEYHKRHLWTAGDSANPSRVYFSNLDDIELWTVTDFFAIETNDGQIVRGIKSALDCIYVFKDASIWRLCGTDRDSFTQEQMVRGVGTCSNQSVSVINNQFLFVTCQGDIAVYDGGITVQVISTKIEGSLADINPDRFDQAISTAFDDGTGDQDYYVALTALGASQTNRLFVFDTFHRAWTRFTGITLNAMATYELGTLKQGIVMGNYAGRSYRYPDTNSDDGVAISARYATKIHSFPQYPQDKTWRLLEVVVNQEANYNLTVETRSDFESTGTTSQINLKGSGSVWNTAVYDTDAYADITATTGRIEVNKRRRFFQAIFTQAGASEPVTIRNWTFWVEPEGRV